MRARIVRFLSAARSGNGNLFSDEPIPVVLPRLTAGAGQAGERVSGDEDEAAEDRTILQ